MPNPNETDKRFQSIRREFRANDAKLVADLRAISKDQTLSSTQKRARRKQRFDVHATAAAAYFDALNKGFADDNSQAIDAAHAALAAASAAVVNARKNAARISDVLNNLGTAADKARKLVDLFD